MKFTSSDFFLLERLRAGFPDKVFFNGSDEMLLSGLAAGADGGIGTTYNFMPEKFLRIYHLYRQGAMAEALEVQSEANPGHPGAAQARRTAGLQGAAPPGWAGLRRLPRTLPAFGESGPGRAEGGGREPLFRRQGGRRILALKTVRRDRGAHFPSRPLCP